MTLAQAYAFAQNQSNCWVCGLMPKCRETIPFVSMSLHVPNESHSETSKEEWEVILDILNIIPNHFSTLTKNHILTFLDNNLTVAKYKKPT